MKKIAFTLYMVSIIIMFPLYVILEFQRDNTTSLDRDPLSILNEKAQTDSQTVNFLRSNNKL